MKNFWKVPFLLFALIGITLFILLVERKFSSHPPASLKFANSNKQKPTKILLLNSSFSKEYPPNAKQDSIVLSLPYNPSSKEIFTKLSIDFKKDSMVEIFLLDHNGSYSKNWVCYSSPVLKQQSTSTPPQKNLVKNLVLDNLFFPDHNTSYKLLLSDAYLDVPDEYVLENSYTISFSKKVASLGILEREPSNDTIADATAIPTLDTLVHCSFDNAFDEDFFFISPSIHSLVENLKNLKKNSLLKPTLFISSRIPLTVELCEDSLSIGPKIVFKNSQTDSHLGIISSHKVNQSSLVDGKNRFLASIPLSSFHKIKKIRFIPFCIKHHSNCADQKPDPKLDLRDFQNLAQIQSLIPDYQFKISLQ